MGWIHVLHELNKHYVEIVIIVIIIMIRNYMMYPAIRHESLDTKNNITAIIERYCCHGYVAIVID